MIGTGFIGNQLHAPLLTLFLDGGDFSHNLMTEAILMAISDQGRYYNVSYQGTYFRIPVENVKFMVESGWVNYYNYQPVPGWSEYTVNYSTYLQPIT
jgi:hypothetical protein